MLASVSAPLRRRFLQQSDPAKIVYVDGVRHNTLVQILDLVYHGRVRVRRGEEHEAFCAAMRSLAVKLGRKVERMVNEDDSAEDDAAFAARDGPMQKGKVWNLSELLKSG